MFSVVGLFAFGCGDETSGPAIYPISGKVLVDGRPAAKAQVSFHALNGPGGETLQPIAIAEADGSFRPSTRFSHDGAPAGNYVVTVVWPKVNLDHGEEVAGPDLLRGKYSDPARSGLTATIKEGENTLPPFQLKTSR
ncbi:hypothetical protein [Singulisphaera sp. GP187]|uniref:hypothetical protein n=1 Tax=Singulisphaera sp. GP187 TaxID=1882752 RepID=UPI0011611E24|nr:hypothetical protein [Singulisphaera sp. GP187]